jgi:hypothetical protein
VMGVLAFSDDELFATGYSVALAGDHAGER